MDAANARARIASMVGVELDVSRRERQWLALGDEVVAFAAPDADSWQRLEAEGRLLARWRAAGIPAPRILDQDAARRVQVRERMHGITGEPVEPLIFGGALPDASVRLSDHAPLSELGARLATSYGELVARIHAATPLADAAALGLGPRPPDDLDAAFAVLRASHASRATVEAAERARSWIAEVPAADAVIHGDLHFHNMCLDESGAIVGIFDVDGSGVDAAVNDLQYVHSLGPRFVALALAAYGSVDEAHVRRAHLRTALCHLNWHGPGAPRHDSIVAWVTAAVDRLCNQRE